jgi:threonine synthase
MVMLKALEQGRQAVGTVSTGNAAASLSAHAAGAGLSAIVFLGKDAPPSKLYKTLIYNPVAVQVQGSYMEADVLFQRAREEFGFFDCQGMVNPFRLEGKKTFAYEIARDLGWQAPSVVFIPTASGTGVVAAWNGFRQLHRLGFIPSLPAIVAVQPAACGPIAHAFAHGLDHVEPVAGGHSIAEAVSVSDPGSGGDRALKAVRESGGRAMAVDEAEIADALRMLADREGLAVEPAGAVGLAALLKLDREGNPWQGGQQVVSLTGHGLNDVQFGQTVVRPPIRVEADYAAVRAALAQVIRPE